MTTIAARRMSASPALATATAGSEPAYAAAAPSSPEIKVTDGVVVHLDVLRRHRQTARLARSTS
ncbi:hypothetical protein AKJ09_10426 [Labilithrix luteola]|uniref:Uncharacterized protein n=1 Tax=Labilithrix luteola TaxID=1391654 RepID=A0A0K1QDH0_9BACT|nr:hypothetical protein [Labilithrix luteola]AKV03763.1 hypothetical protein AKJ09_10426 [Labilithrix luteola]